MDPNGVKPCAEIARYGNHESTEYVWKSKTKAYYKTKEIPGVHVPTFGPVEIFNRPWLKDKNTVYFIDQKINGADPATFVQPSSASENPYDKNYVYDPETGKVKLYHGKKVYSVNDFLGKTDTEIVQLVNEHEALPPEMDVHTLKRVSESYSMDKNNVYYAKQKVFTVTNKNKDHIRAFRAPNIRIVTDGEKVYFGSSMEKKFDAKTIGAIRDSNDYFYDKNGIYQWGYDSKKKQRYAEKFPFKYAIPFQMADLGKYDGYWVFYRGQAYNPYDKKYYADIDPNSFEDFQDYLVNRGNLYYKDLNHLILKDAKDVKGWEIWKGHGGLIQASNRLFHNGIEVKVADIEHFERIKDTDYYKDSKNVYAYSFAEGLQALPEANPAAFKLISIFGTDDKRVFWGSALISQISSIDLELVNIIEGNRQECSLDKTPSSDHYILKNKDGYWRVTIASRSKIKEIRNLDRKRPEDFVN